MPRFGVLLIVVLSLRCGACLAGVAPASPAPEKTTNESDGVGDQTNKRRLQQDNLRTPADEMARCNAKAGAVNDACCTTGGYEDRVCEGGQMSIDCAGRGDGAINIQFASYGRQHGPDVCPHAAASNQQCHETTSTAIVAAACQGQASCAVDATNAAFGDPCGGTYKYLTVNYDCGGQTVSTCANGQPSACSSECARIFAPFYSKCAAYLDGVQGLDMNAVTNLCQGSGAATVGGLQNGGFDDEDLDVCTYVCTAAHEWGPFDGTVCGHHYMEPAGWSSSGTAVVCNANSGPWGGLISGASIHTRNRLHHHSLMPTMFLRD